MKRKEKILLLYPGEFHSQGWGRFICLKPHMVYIYSYLQRFFDVTVLDLENEFSRPQTPEELAVFKTKSLKRIQGIDADMVAISCWSSLNYLSSVFFAEAIKKERPDTPIIVGGYHPTFLPRDFTYPESPFDVVVQGEIQNIFKAIHKDRFEAIETYRIVPDFRTYPYFDHQKTLGIFLGAGCPFNCRYCMEYKRKWSSLRVEEAIDLILRLKRDYDPHYFTIFDACFGLNNRWRKAFLSALSKADLDCYFWLETRVDVVDEEDLELMSGLKIKMDFGVDSFSRTMLNIMNKTRNPDAFLKTFVKISSICNRLDILHDVYLIFDHPGETRETYAEFKQFFQDVVRQRLEGGHLRVKYQRFSYYPGNYIFNHQEDYARQYGFKAIHPEWWRRAGDHYLSSREIIPSVDEHGQPFHVPLKETSKMVKAFNRKAKEEALWQKLHAFDL
ncbi:MAG: cobalamin-dependent protein [Deltaproteobacteria bacterium]|nr:cobalamin-dependent protein [Deltaproteobacteria bacterium]